MQTHNVQVQAGKIAKQVDTSQDTRRVCHRPKVYCIYQCWYRAGGSSERSVM
jgi:hypothetical protein